MLYFPWGFFIWEAVIFVAIGLSALVVNKISWTVPEDDEDPEK